MTIRTTTVFETEDGKTHKTEGEAVMHALDVIGKDILKNHANGSIRAGLLHHADKLVPLLLFVRDELRCLGGVESVEQEIPDEKTTVKPSRPSYDEWMKRSEAFKDGWESYRAGKQVQDNPFLNNGVQGREYDQWDQGFKASLNSGEHPSRP